MTTKSRKACSLRKKRLMMRVKDSMAWKKKLRRTQSYFQLTILNRGRCDFIVNSRTLDYFMTVYDAVCGVLHCGLFAVTSLCGSCVFSGIISGHN
mmetsp:Transcript_4248/g.9952  ORF Transcript_4248/g.9952 Transcript_4248/m.9952 type:complete len:95 (+) Transcript_4248:1159-1443(+)